MSERLAKFIARSGVCSRRAAEELILQKRITVNGEIVDSPAFNVDGSEKILLDGEKLPTVETTRLWLYYKPVGLVTTHKDTAGRPTVFDNLPAGLPRVISVGRLDLNSEGLLLLTNDGELANRLTHPKKEVDKVYLVWLSRYIPGCEASIASPIEIDGRTTRPAKVETLRAEDETALLRITIHEGRNRQIRRLCERANVTVTRLRRIAEGLLTLGELKPGQWRRLTPEELRKL